MYNFQRNLPTPPLPFNSGTCFLGRKAFEGFSVRKTVRERVIAKEEGVYGLCIDLRSIERNIVFVMVLESYSL